MVTPSIHSLPPELLYQILAEVAWTPPHLPLQLRFNKLRATSLVHTSWRAPSQHLLTKQISFFNFTPGSRAERFLASGGVEPEWVCDELELSGRVGRGDAVSRVVSKAKRIRHLNFHALYAGGIPKDLFLEHALVDLEALHISRADLLPGLSLPTRLVHLSLPATSAPASTDPQLRQLVQANLATLTSLKLQVNLRRESALDSMLPALLLAAPRLLRLSIFCLPAFNVPGSACPASLVALLSACTSLEHLTIAKLPTEHLKPLLSSITSPEGSACASIRTVAVNLPGGSADENESAITRAQTTAKLMAECVELKRLRRVRRWSVTRRESQWEAEQVWRKARAEVEEGGVQIELFFEA